MNQPFFHVGIVVENIEAAQADLGERMGLEWSTVQTFSIPVLMDGKRSVPVFKFVYSKTGPPYTELIEVCEPPWGPESVGIHHVGLWTDNYWAELRAAQDAGRVLAYSDTEEGQPSFAYIKGEDGVLTELVDRPTTEPPLMRYIAGGTFG